MPKKSHGRPAGSRNRQQRRPASRGAAPAQNLMTEEMSIPDSPVPVAPQTTARGFTSAAVAAAPSRRAVAASKRAQAATINYTYLGHDIRLLGILAPSMVVLVILAYVFIPR